MSTATLNHRDKLRLACRHSKKFLLNAMTVLPWVPEVFLIGGDRIEQRSGKKKPLAPTDTCNNLISMPIPIFSD